MSTSVLGNSNCANPVKKRPGPKSKTEVIVKKVKVESDSDSVDTDDDLKKFYKTRDATLKIRHSYRLQFFVDITEPDNVGLKVSSVSGERNGGKDYCESYERVEGEVFCGTNSKHHRLIRLCEIQFTEENVSSSCTIAIEKYECLITDVIDYQHHRKPNKYLGLSPRSENHKNSKFRQHWGVGGELQAATKSLWTTDCFSVTDKLRQLFPGLFITFTDFYKPRIQCTKADILNFVKRSGNIRKIESQHADKLENLDCELCKHTFSTSASLWNHLKDIHNQEYLVCEICWFMTLLKQYMDKHTNKHPLHDCDLCKRPFSSATGVATHKRLKRCPEERQYHSNSHKKLKV